MSLELESQIINLAKEYKKRVIEADVIIDNYINGDGLEADYWPAIHDRSDAKIALIDKIMELD